MTPSYEELASFPPLPTELVREVIELATLSDKSTALALALVSKVVKSWVTPLIYHTITLETRENILSFIHSLEAAQCVSEDNSRFIRDLAIHKYAIQHCDWALSLCQHVQRLLLWPPYRTLSVDDSAEGESLWPQPWYIMLIEAPIPWLTQRIPLFTNTTHLYVDEALHPPLLQLLAGMPSLTHICFGFWGDEEYTEVVLRGTVALLSMPLMKMVLIHAFISGASIEDFYGGVWAHLAEISDERLFVAPGILREDLFGLFGLGNTVWDSVAEWKDWRERVQPDEGLSPYDI